ncbi:hypothetical protein EYC84_012040 [Monilinia fructicola]|uniref:Uncharacterized protein n=1 Tax=Monilinia fructicola TaxID=38448 RepID=A0A5M9J4C9_MONFR|nr:hypothetical protein EYC84_012040 [Monilinia fructicola]
MEAGLEQESDGLTDGSRSTTALGNVVAGEGSESKISVGGYCGIKIDEGLSIAGRSNGILGLGVKLRIGEESINSIWLNLWSITIWLSSTWSADIRGSCWWRNGSRSSGTASSYGCSG